jgi:hypothetical protein
MIQLAITRPVSSATCERSLSAMRRINNYLRSNMSQEWFSKLALLDIERDIIVDTEIILNSFAKQNLNNKNIKFKNYIKFVTYTPK